tara:strand:- start:1142 stop:1621 length:480 start_codon:yes stop_codon:yes gene_type:complete
MSKKTNTILIFILFGLSVSLISAYIIEYVLGHEPCRLCVYQRFPYIVSILLVLSILLIKKNVKIHLLLLSLVSLLGAVLAFYHFGIEQGFFSESIVCESQNLQEGLTKQDILKQLKQNTISCKDVNFTLFGLSLASINIIVSFILFMIFIRLYRNYEIN